MSSVSHRASSGPAVQRSAQRVRPANVWNSGLAFARLTNKTIAKWLWFCQEPCNTIFELRFCAISTASIAQRAAMLSCVTMGQRIPVDYLTRRRARLPGCMRRKADGFCHGGLGEPEQDCPGGGGCASLMRRRPATVLTFPHDRLIFITMLIG